MKRNTLKIEDNGMGHGRTILNGIDISGVIAGYKVVGHAGEPLHVLLSVVVHELEMAGDDVKVTIDEVRPEDTPLQHQIGLGPHMLEICTTCRQIVGNPKWNPDVCPGPMGKKA